MAGIVRNQALAGVALLLVGGSVSGQTPTSTACSDGSAMVSGQLATPDPGPTLHVTVHVTGSDIARPCSVQATAPGEFLFDGLREGSYSLRITGLNTRLLAPIDFEVDSGESVVFTISLAAQNPLTSCLELPACAPILTRPLAAEQSADDSHALELLSYRTTLALAGENWSDTDWMLCVDGSPAVVEALRTINADAGSGEDCYMPDPRVVGFERPARQLHHRASGRLARLLHTPRVEQVNERSARVNIGYTVGPLWGVSYECSAEKTGPFWTMLNCFVTGVS